MKKQVSSLDDRQQNLDFRSVQQSDALVIIDQLVKQAADLAKQLTTHAIISGKDTLLVQLPLSDTALVAFEAYRRLLEQMEQQASESGVDMYRPVVAHRHFLDHLNQANNSKAEFYQVGKEVINFLTDLGTDYPIDLTFSSTLFKENVREFEDAKQALTTGCRHTASKLRLTPHDRISLAGDCQTLCTSLAGVDSLDALEETLDGVFDMESSPVQSDWVTLKGVLDTAIDDPINKSIKDLLIIFQSQLFRLEDQEDHYAKFN